LFEKFKYNSKWFDHTFCTIICTLILFSLYATLMTVTKVTETCWWRKIICDWTYLQMCTFDSLYKNIPSILFKTILQCVEQRQLVQSIDQCRGRNVQIRERSVLPRQKVLNTLSCTKMIQDIPSIDESVSGYNSWMLHFPSNL
jgi:hypothetical protein